jgi:type III pantothenate kinase
VTGGTGSLVFAADAGNTRVKFGLFEATAHPLPQCQWCGARPCGRPLPIADWAPVLATGSVRVVLSGSNPDELDRLQRRWPAAWPRPQLRTERARIPIDVDVEFPERVGLDRLLNSVAALRLREPNQPAIIVDSGTAMTIDYVSNRGVFCGGAILPGIGMGARALHRYTALLPLLSAPEIAEAPPPCVGKNTQAAMLSGLYWGQIGAARELVERMSRQARSEARSPLVLATGGAGQVLAAELPGLQYEPHLSLQGLVLSAEH